MIRSPVHSLGANNEQLLQGILNNLSQIFSRGLLRIILDKPFSTIHFIFRCSTGDIPEFYWSYVIKESYAEISDELKKLILLVKERGDIQESMLEFIARHIASKIIRAKIDVPFTLPTKGIIVDIGSGYLTGPSRFLVKYAMVNKGVTLYLVDNRVLIADVIRRILRLIGSPRNIILKCVDIRSLLVSNADLITLLFTLHEATDELRKAEFLRYIGRAKINRCILYDNLVVLRGILRSVHRIIGESGRLIVLDKEMDEFGLKFVGELVINEGFRVIRSEYINNKFLVEAKKLLDRKIQSVI